ncbi:MAG: hypothetical protein RJA70_1266 [Pseudomonadota bacterium]|jgi:hypothetical protein
MPLAAPTLIFAGTPCALPKLMTPLYKQYATRLMVVPLAASASGCAVVETIFKAGFWVGFVAVALVLTVAFGLLRLLRG